MRGIQICGAGRAGDGTNTQVMMLGQVLKDLGAWVLLWREEIYSNIQTRDSCFGLRAADAPIYGPEDEIDLLEAFDQGALADIAGEGRVPPVAKLRPGGVLLYDSSPRLEYPNAGHEVRLEPVAELLERRRIRVYRLPMGQMAKEQFGSYIVRGTIALGVISYALRIPQEAFLGRFARTFGEGSQPLTLNWKALALGHRYAQEQGWEGPDLKGAFRRRTPDDRQLILGDEAVAVGAIVAGCRFFAGYPITPASEVLEYMAEKLPRFGGAVIQADSEMAAAHHILGASLAGARAMTATSGPGFSLMQEAISAAGMTETPMVIVMCQRGGPATGLPTKIGQEDLNETVFGGHGDFARIVLAASEPEEAFYVMERVFNLAERYQCPVFLLLDQMMAQSSYTIPRLEPSRFAIDRGKLLDAQAVARGFATPRNLRFRGDPALGGNGHYRRYQLTADGISPRVIPGTPGVHTYYSNTNEHTEEGYITEEAAIRQAMVEKRVPRRMALIRRDPQLPPPRLLGHPTESSISWGPHLGPPGAPTGFIGYGSVYGPILEAMERLERQGQPARFLELRTLWPFPGREVRRFVQGCQRVYVAEYSAGAQLRGLIQREATGPMPRKLRSILRYDGRLMTPGYVLNAMEGA